MSNLTNNHRFLYLDIARVLCIIEVIFYVHLQNYYWVHIPHIMFDYGLTIGSLATLFFISGLTSKISFDYTSNFYKRKLVRIYVPFACAFGLMCLTNSMEEPITWHSVVYGLTGLSCFLGHQPRTLWFIDVLLLCYALVPIVLLLPFKINQQYAKRSQIGIILLILSIFVCLYLIGYLDQRIIVYTPFFFIGLIFPPSKFDKKPIWLLGAAMIVLGCCYLLLLRHVGYDKITCWYVYALVGVLCCIIFSFLISKLNMLQSIWKALSFASYFAYLLHRSVFDILNCFGFWEWCNGWYILGLFVVLFSSAYIFQYAYNSLIKSLKIFT